MSLRRLALYLSFALAMTLGHAAAAQQPIGRIVASVNDVAITDFDLTARIALLTSSSGQAVDDALRQRIARQALRELIDESLQTQEAKRLGIKVTDQEVSAGIQRIERRNRMQPGALFQELSRGGVPVDTLIAQVKATLVWRKVLRRRILPQIQVAEAEVDEALARIRAAGGGDLLRAAELFIPVERPEDREEARRFAARLAEQASSSQTFGRLARQHSRAPSAAVGGDLGELQLEQLQPALRDALAKLAPGQTSEPIDAETGVYLMHLVSRRAVAAGAPEQAVVTIARAFLPASGDANSQAAMQRLTQTLQGIDGCDAFERAAATLGQQPPRVVDARIGDLPEEVREAMDELEPGDQTTPLPIGDGFAVMMLCRRAEGGSNLPSAERVAEAIQTQRAERRAERYLRDLRRLAFIDIRG